MNAPEFPAERVAAAAAQLLRQPVTQLPEHIAAGLGNENWRIVTSGGQVLCKIGPSAQIAKWRAAARGRELAEAAGVPVPHLRAATEASALLDGRPLRVFDYIGGCRPDLLPAPLQRRFWRELGVSVGRLHQVALPGFSSRLDGSAPSFSNWVEYLEYRLPQIQARVRATRCFEGASVARLWEQVLRAARIVDRHIQPRLVHRDLHLDNLLATSDGGIAALLDFDLAEAWDPAAEFFKLRHFAFAGERLRADDFAEGYGDHDRALPEFAVRVNIACTVELVNMAANDALANDAAGIDWTTARLALVLDDAGWTHPER